MAIPTVGVVLFIIIIIFIAALLKGIPIFEKGIIQKGGTTMSLANHAEFFRKMLEESIPIIARKAAYDLGKTGGTSQNSLWNEGEPSLWQLETELEERIKDNLPNGEILGKRRIVWKESQIDVLGYDYAPCGPIASSKCFVLKGNKNFSIYDDSIETRMSIDYMIDMEIASNYFRLLKAGRTIMEDFSDYLDDAGRLTNQIYAAKTRGDSRFWNLDVFVSVTGDIVQVTILETCNQASKYCLAPLRPGETGGLGQIPYGYVQLIFKYQMGQTDFTPLEYDFELLVEPNQGNVFEVCP